MKTRKQTFLLATALLLALGLMLLAGLKPKGFRIRNDVTWLKDTPGIAFGRMGIAYTEDSLTWSTSAGAPDRSVTIELSLKSTRRHGYGIPYILSLWDGATPDPLVVGQWKNHLVIRVRDPRSRKGYLETGADNALPRDTTNLITIASGTGGTAVYVNGQRAEESASVSLIPASGLSARLVLGNSATADHAWQGDLYGVTVFTRKLTAAEITERYRNSDSLGRAGLPNAPGVLVHYAFREGHGSARNSAGDAHRLRIPRIFRILQLQILALPWEGFRFDASTAEDVVVNFAGFMPFGFLLAALLLTGPTSTKRRAVVLTVLAGFLLSLFIELTQVWIPTRCSQMTDLVLNTVGAWVGAMVAGAMRDTRGKAKAG